MHEIVIEEEQKPVSRNDILFWTSPDYSICIGDGASPGMTAKIPLPNIFKQPPATYSKINSKDDFAWPNILRTTTAYVQKYAPTFPNRFTIVQPIALGRYIPDKGHFIITDKTQYKM